MASRNVWITVAIVIIVIIVGAGVYYIMTQTPPSSSQTPTKTITLYEGDRVVNGSLQYVFGFSQDSMTSPGPTLNFNVDDIVNITVYNVGTIPHSWAIVNAKSDTATVLFNAHVGSGDNPLAPGSHGSDVFQVTAAGNYYYVCQVPGHIDVGMWGNVIVT